MCPDRSARVSKESSVAYSSFSGENLSGLCRLNCKAVDGRTMAPK